MKDPELRSACYRAYNDHVAEDCDFVFLTMPHKTGAEFAREVSRLEPGQWHGPVLSGYGVHFVYVDVRSEVVPAEFVAVLERVQQDWQDERRRVFNEEFYARLRARYEVVVEDAAPDPDYAALTEDAP